MNGRVLSQPVIMEIFRYVTVVSFSQSRKGGDSPLALEMKSCVFILKGRFLKLNLAVLSNEEGWNCFCCQPITILNSYVFLNNFAIAEIARFTVKYFKSKGRVQVFRV